MALPRVLLLLLPVAAGACAWLILAGDRSRPVGPEGYEPSAQRPAIPAAPRSVEPSLPRADPSSAPVEPEDPEWITRDLPSLKGQGSLRGSELVDAVERAGPLRFRGATPADLEALRRVAFEDVDRDAPAPYAALAGWLKEAGFELEVVYPTLTVRRRTDEDWTGR